MRHRIKIGSYAPEKQEVVNDKLENTEATEGIEEIFEEDSELSDNDEALAAMEFYDSPDEIS